jgi:hypothetical protein
MILVPDARLAPRLVLDELFDVSLYRVLHRPVTRTRHDFSFVIPDSLPLSRFATRAR